MAQILIKVHWIGEISIFCNDKMWKWNNNEWIV